MRLHVVQLDTFAVEKSFQRSYLSNSHSDREASVSDVIADVSERTKLSHQEAQDGSPMETTYAVSSSGCITIARRPKPCMSGSPGSKMSTETVSIRFLDPGRAKVLGSTYERLL